MLKPGARINLKTDSKELYDFTLEVIEDQGCPVHENIADVYGKGLNKGPLAIQTFYEKMHLADGRTIYFLSFSLPPDGVKLEGRFAKLNTADDTTDDVTEV